MIDTKKNRKLTFYQYNSCHLWEIKVLVQFLVLLYVCDISPALSELNVPLIMMRTSGTYAGTYVRTWGGEERLSPLPPLILTYTLFLFQSRGVNYAHTFIRPHGFSDLPTKLLQNTIINTQKKRYSETPENMNQPISVSNIACDCKWRPLSSVTCLLLH